ncbi:ATP-binding protein [Xanthobacteraceae bacterium A53D]
MKVRSGEATWNEALLLLLERRGYPEETYHSFSYSPLYGVTRQVEGLLCIVNEVTERVITERRLSTLRQLGAALVGVGSREEVGHAVCATLGTNRLDFPFALLMLGDDTEAHRLACSEDAEALLESVWPHADASEGQFFDLGAQLAAPCGGWNVPPREALIVPILGAANRAPVGKLILGLNPYRRRDEGVGDLPSLLAAQISGALANVAALDAERRRADRIWTNLRDLLVTVGADNVYQSVSPSWTHILGHPVDHVVGRAVSDFIASEDRESTAHALSLAADGDNLTAFENRLTTASGELRWISWHTAVENGLVYGYGRDVTEVRVKAEALEVAEEALRHSQKMEAIGQLTGGIAHDFNNLLTGITGSLDLVRRKLEPGLSVDVERFLAVAVTSAERAAALTQRLLAFARRQSLDPQSVALPALVEGMRGLIEKSIGELIVLTMDMPPGLWPAHCDPNQLESAILNLAINSRDAMAHEGRLTIRAENISAPDRNLADVLPPGDYVSIIVEDTGQGMPPDVMSRAFDPFFTTKPLGKGTGLGLSMVYGFAQQSGGAVRIESTEGAGTSVSILIPRSGADSQPAAQPTNRIPQDGRITQTATVLVVEDEPAVRLLVSEVLSDLGYDIREAETGPDGLAILLSDARSDLLLTDVGLPGLNGRQLADAARAKRPGLKVLFVTGYERDLHLYEGGLEAGMAMVTKPFDIDRLAERVRTLLQS